MEAKVAIINGTSGNDLIIANSPGVDDTINGLEDFDDIFYDQETGPQGIIANFKTGIFRDTGGGTDIVTSFQGLGATDRDDTIIGSDEREIFRPFGGADTIDGGGGNDLVHYALDYNHGFRNGVSVDLALGRALDPSGSVDTLTSIERVRGTQFDDHILGDDNNNEFNPVGGSDFMDGRGGTDTLQYRELFDSYYDFSSTITGVTIDLAAGVATDMIGGTDTFVSIENAQGSVFADNIAGDAGANVLGGFGGDDYLDGREGLDTALFSLDRSEYTVSGAGSSTVTVTHNNGGDDGSDTLQNFERIGFADGVLAMDIAGTAGQAYRIYQAAFDRTPDNDGLRYWIDSMDDGTSLSDVASGFLASEEFAQVYGDDASDEEFVARLYQNILERDGEAAGLDYWTDQLDSGGMDRTAVLANFSESAENVALVAPAINDGIWYAY